VQWTILARNAFPDDRRKWLDLFEASSPSNSLANYLSAQDYLKNGQTNDAITSFWRHRANRSLGTYSTEALLDGEELNRFAGKTPLESEQLAFSHSMTDVLTEDGTLKQLAWSVADLEKQQVAIGDSISVENLAQMGLAFADQIRSGENGKLIINQLVGTPPKRWRCRVWIKTPATIFLMARLRSRRCSRSKNGRRPSGN